MTRYELLDRIGVGGMAEIFRGKAVAAGGFEKPVAIKRILPHLSQDRRFVELLIAEAKVLSLLKHRNIVQIFDVGLGDDGTYFLVMEYVDGVDIGAVQRALEGTRRRIPYALVLHIGAEICEALDHAHTSRGPDGRPMSLVHRDVSPSNVLLSRAGEVKLTDFGIAKRAESEVTQGAAVRGKFAYISPEQARNEHVDPSSDVFSVGILVWELLANRRLFSGLGDLEALRAVRGEPIPSPTSVDSRLPREVDAIVMTALSRDKARRYTRAGELGQALRSLRYALDATVGDPAAEVARLVESTLSPPAPAPPARPSAHGDFDGNEATVIRIHTADAFGERDDAANTRLAHARDVIGRFVEDEETRLAQLSGEQMRKLRNTGPLAEHDGMTRPRRKPVDTPPNSHLTPTDETRLVRAPSARPPSEAPLTLDEPASYSHSQSVTHAPLTLDEEPISVSRSQSHSQSVTRAPAASTPTPTPTPTPPPTPPPVPLQPPPVVAPVPAPAPSSFGWGPPLAVQGARAPTQPPLPPQIAPPKVAPVPAPTPAPAYERSSTHRSRSRGTPKRAATSGVWPWLLIVGALLVAIAAFAITRAFIR